MAKQEVSGTSTTPKGKGNTRGKNKKTIVKSAYNLRSRTVSKELVKFKRKESVEPEKKSKKRDKYHKAYLGRHNSPIEVLYSPLDGGGNTDLEYNHYLLSLVSYEDSDEGGIIVPPISSRTRSERAYSDVDDSK